MVLWAVSIATATAEWETLRDCRLLPNNYNDGDSFHVEADGEERIFRLYFADTPESSDQVPERVAEQAEHFGVSKTEVMHAGKEAAAFTARALRKRFTVTTRWQNARGASALPRSYASITTAEGKDLAELLVAAGLARAHGAVADVPRSKDMGHYEALEGRARRAGVGIFGNGKASAAGLADAANDIETKASPTPTPEETSSLADDVFARLQQESWGDAGTLEIKTGIPMTGGNTQARRPDDPTQAPASANVTASKVSLNTAAKAELESLPGIGPMLAAAIIRSRPYANVEDLRRVPGIGPKKFDQIKELVAP